MRIREDWRVIEEIPFTSLAKLSLPTIGEPEELSVKIKLRNYHRKNPFGIFLGVPGVH